MWILLVGFIIGVAFLTRKQFPKLNGLYSQQADAWYYVKVAFLTVILAAAKLIRVIKRRRHPEEELKQHRLTVPIRKNDVNASTFVVSDKDGNVISVHLRRHFGRVAEVGLVVRMADGRVLTHALQPDCLTVDETPSDDEADEGYVAAGGVRLRAIDPARTYRLLYCGLMRVQQPDDAANAEPQFTEVSLRFWFRSLTDPANFGVDFCPRLAAECIAPEPSVLALLLNFVNPPTAHNEQSGELRGVVEVTGTRHELSLNGLRDYKTGPSKIQQNAGFFILRARLENGLVLSLHITSQKDAITHNVAGFVTYQTGYVYPVTWADLHLSHLPNEGNVPKHFTLNLTAHGRVFELSVDVLSSAKFHLLDSRNASSSLVVHENVVKVQLNGDKIGYGTVEFNNTGERFESESPRTVPPVLIKEIATPQTPQTVPQCVQLHDPLCRISGVTGGKAAKLADIVAVVGKMDQSKVDLKVPDGFAITVAAYENHIKNNPNLAERVARVLEISSKLNRCEDKKKLESLAAELEAACKQLHDAFLAAPLTAALERDIIQHMQKTFGAKDWEQTFTAVRSSAVGEDGTEASGAGQMETFLGMRGKDKIFEAVKLCWASHYAFRAIQYRRQLCAKLDSPMAVLVQGLVKADVAGVLFTRHPDSGSTAQSIINACYGIGEGVVSGHVQPDTISVYQVDPRNPNEIRIAYDVLGEKATAYVLDEEKGLVEEEDVSAIQLDRSEGCCLDQDEIRRLYHAGKFIEQIFGSCRDVEFAMKKDAASGTPSIFILQARPITTADMEQEWELIHEFDSPLFSDGEFQTTANVQEMMPGALTPLSGKVWMDSIGGALEKTNTDAFLKPRRRFNNLKLATMYHQHVFMNWTMIGAGMTNEFNKMSGDMALFGKRIDYLKTEMFIEQNDMSGALWPNILKCVEWKQRLLPGKGMEALTDKIDAFQTPSATDPVELYNQIKALAPFLMEVWSEHLKITFEATFYPMILMHTMDSTLNWDSQLYADIALMLSSCTDVFSADVPTLLQAIARSIGSDDDALKRFLEMDRLEGARWLLSKESGQHGELFKKFLAKHGHRCVRDSDVREKSWNEEPEKVIDALKVMASSKLPPSEANTQKKELSVIEAIEAIKTPLNRTQKFVLKMILPKARRAVGLREWAKSYGIKMHDHYRRALFRLAVILTERGYLPDTDLLFFLTPEEIESLLEKRSPKLIAKALRRRKLFPKFSGLQFPEIFSGHAHPVKSPERTIDPNAKTFNIKGTAVGSGCIEGKARVVKSLAEANQIQAGDILIVPYTDVGWTPYFPMISGLVTELGGLISHGAVVAREYGLPCLVGCKQATEYVKTGDCVYINGSLGQIEVQVNSADAPEPEPKN